MRFGLDMIEFSECLSRGSVTANQNLVHKKGLFQRLAQIGADEIGQDKQIIFEALMAREKLGPTGFGGGTAIPHARIDGLESFHAAVLTLKPAIDYDAVDGAPVDLVVMLLSPSDAGAEHLKMLAQVSRFLRDEVMVAKLRGAASDDALFSLLVPIDTRDAA